MRVVYEVTVLIDCSGATPETVKKAFEILVSDPKVKSIFINIFGGTTPVILSLTIADYGRRYHALRLHC